jgi:hypothetical protein
MKFDKLEEQLRNTIINILIEVDNSSPRKCRDYRKNLIKLQNKIADNIVYYFRDNIKDAMEDKMRGILEETFNLALTKIEEEKEINKIEDSPKTGFIRAMYGIFPEINTVNKERMKKLNGRL